MKQLPLAETLRPKTLNEVFGHESITESKGWIHATIQSQQPQSVLFFGPAGCGKTTLAKIYLESFSGKKVVLDPAGQGVSQLKNLLSEENKHPLFSSTLLIFADELHRLNRAQQDLFLPFIENGSIILVSCTTENPSFAINSALLSRMHVISLEPLSYQSLEKMIERAILSHPIQLSKQAKQLLIEYSKGDGRYLLNMMQTLIGANFNTIIDESILQKILQKRPAIYDKKDHHFQIISALQKSIRASDPDSALYWFSRMIISGEDPLYIARRLLRIASEDIGLADPQATSITLTHIQAYERLGSPEGDLSLAQAIVYLSLSPKSNSVYMALKKAKEKAETTSHILPKLTPYFYDHDTKQGCAGQNFLPKELEKENFYIPIERGFERELSKRKEYFEKIRKQKKGRFEDSCKIRNQ